MEITINQILKQAVNLHNKGNFVEAESLYKGILENELGVKILEFFE